MGADTAVESPQELLLSLCRLSTAVSSKAVTETAELRGLSTEDSARRFFALAAEHKIRGLVYRAAQHVPAFEELPVGVAGAIRKQLQGLHERAAGQDAELARLLRDFRRAGLTPVILKGPALRWSVYDSPVERWYGDFDVLLPEDQFEAAVRCAISAGYEVPYSRRRFEGYRRHHHHVLLRHPKGYPLEVHWALSPPRATYHLEPRAYLRRTRELVATQELRFRVPCAELLLLHAASDNRRHAFSRLQKTVDVARLIAAHPELDWDLLCSQAEKAGEASILWLTLKLAEKLLLAAVPESVASRLSPSRLAGVHLDLLISPAWIFGPRPIKASDARILLRIWLAADARSRARELFALAEHDDLAWLWQSDWSRPVERVGRLGRAKRVLRAPIAQALLYGRMLTR